MALSNTKKKVQAVLFDMDGTLFDSERIYFTTWQLAAQEFGFDGAEEKFAALIGVHHENIVEAYESMFEDTALARRVYEFRIRENARLEQETTPALKPGADRLLHALWGAGIPTALATSSLRPKVDAQFAAAGLTNRFPVVITGDMPKRGKPSPDIFLLAAERLGVPIEECAVIEDSVSGLLAGKASGAYTILVPDVLPPTPAQIGCADAVLPGLDDVLETLCF